MEGRRGIYIVLIIAILLLIAALVFYFTRGLSVQSQPTISNLKDCNTLKFNEETGVNVLFFSNKQEAEQYSDLLLSLSPFSENEKSFNFYYITPSVFDATQYCEIYQGVAVLCYQKEIIKVASSCPHDYIAVVDSYSAGIRSSAYKDVMSINSASPIVVFAHEFGHVFANLAEEYVPASIPFGSKNCQSSCDKFESDVDGCYNGCSRGDYKRSHEASIMRTLRSLTFGQFNEKLLSERISESIIEKGAITGNALFDFKKDDCKDQSNYFIEGKKVDGKFQIISTELRTGCSSGANTLGDVKYDVYDINSQNTLSNRFSFNIFTDGQTDVQGSETIKGKIYQNEDSFFITTPATGQESELTISDNNDSTTVNLENLGDNNPCHL